MTGIIGAVDRAAPPIELDDVVALGEELIRLRRRRTDGVEGAVLETSAFRLLWVLSDGTARTLRRLAEELDLEQSTVNRQVNAAIGAGWLERYAVAGSASRLVRPTAAGHAAYEHDGGLRARMISAALETLGPERARRLIADLRDLNDAWDGAPRP